MDIIKNFYRTHKSQCSVWQKKSAWDLHLLIAYLLSGIKKTKSLDLSPVSSFLLAVLVQIVQIYWCTNISIRKEGEKKGENRAVFPNKPSPSLSVHLKSDGTDRPLIILSYNQQMQGLRICGVNLSPSEIFIRRKKTKTVFFQRWHIPQVSLFPWCFLWTVLCADVPCWLPPAAHTASHVCDKLSAEECMFLNILEVQSHKQILHSPKICTMNLAGDYKKKTLPFIRQRRSFNLT